MKELISRYVYTYNTVYSVDERFHKALMNGQVDCAHKLMEIMVHADLHCVQKKTPTFVFLHNS